MYATLSYSVQDAIALVRLNRPDRLNAVNGEMVDELEAVTAAIRADDSVRVVVFTGAGRAFSAGADISGLADMASAADFYRFIEAIQAAYSAIADLDRPTIAALNGLAYGGGCELAIACDLRIMAQEATIGVPEVKIGILPGAGGTQRLTHLLPTAIAKQMILTGEPLTAAQALNYGLVNAVVPPEELMATALEWANRLAQLPPMALRAGKLLIHTALSTDLKSGIEAERQAVAFLFGTEDRAEGMRAFLKKRSPKFEGR